MTPEEINIAIAKHCGYEFRIDDKQWGNDPDFTGAVGVYAPCGGFVGRYDKDWTCIPNYHSDLNAMHEAEEELGAKARYYEDELANRFNDGFISARFTAAQRAEAFLRTVGKWLD